MPKAPVKKDALSIYNERFAQMAREAKHAESKVGGAGNFISLKGGIMTYAGAAIPENKIRCVVIDAILENQLYTGAFDPDNFAAPTCYAFGRDPDTIAPNPEYVAEPVSSTCAECPNMEWGSAEVGKGKACKEVRRLALITEADLEGVADGEVAFLKVPVTSVKGWAGYVRQLDEVYHRPPFAFVTEIAIVKSNDGTLPGYHLEFKMERDLVEEGVAADIFDALFKRHEKMKTEIAFPYPKVEEDAAPQRRGNGRQQQRRPAAPQQRRAAVAAPQKRTPLPPPVRAAAAGGARKPKF